MVPEDERLAFLGLEASDLALLGELRALFEKHADRLVEAFYRHLLSFPATRRFLRDPEVTRRLLGTQRGYLLSLAGPEIDDAYVEGRRRIGEAHERIGLDLKWYLGAYGLYLQLLRPLIEEHYLGDPERAGRAVGALTKLLIFDAQIALETYVERRERDLERLNRELARAQRALARDLEEAGVELRHTERRARAAEELASVATLVAGLAHEIGTPMGVIQGHARLLERDVAGEQALWRLRTIQEQITRISRIIQALLNMARPARMQTRPVDLASVVETTLGFVSEKLRRRGIEAVTDLGPAPSVLGDAERLQQLLLNLFLNAADAMPEGGELRVAVAPEDDRVRVVVEDTGMGIDPDHLPRLFEPFFSTKPAGRGSGLGLAVVKGIVADHGGEIDVESEPGRGTTFTIRLPVAGSSVPDETPSGGSPSEG